MIDPVSSTQNITPTAPNTKSPQDVGLEVGVSMIKKSMDTASAAMLQLLQGMGIGNNIDKLA